MGYTTDFYGKFSLDRPLTPDHKAYLDQFAGSRRMKRNTNVTSEMNDPLRHAVGLPLGKEGEYYVGVPSSGGDSWRGQGHTPDIQDFNESPGEQPGLWCQWVPNVDGDAIEWDEGEKFYSYIPWINYLIDHFLKPWGYILNGECQWQGEDSGDIGKIVIVDNVVTILEGYIEYRERD